MQSEDTIYLIEIDPKKSAANADGSLDTDKAVMTGRVGHVPEEVYQAILGGLPTDREGNPVTAVFVDPEMLEDIVRLLNDYIAQQEKESSDG